MSDTPTDAPDEQTTRTTAELLGDLQPRRRTVRILLRQDLLAEHEALEARFLAELKLDETENRKPVAPALAQELGDLEDAIDAAKVSFTFQSIGHRRWADLQMEHPPSDEEREVGAQWSRAFPVAVIAASAVEPTISVDEAEQLEERLPDLEFQALWQAAAGVNIGGGDSPKAIAAGIVRRMSEPSATTPVPEAFPGASS